MTATEKRDLLVKQAEKYSGLDDPRHFVQVYNNYVGYEAMFATWPWCACFVSAVAIEAGFADLIPQNLSCCQMITLFSEKGRFVEDDNYIPKRGDIIFFDWSGSTDYDSRGATTTDHVGIVTDVSGGLVYTIEGNRSNKVMHASYSIGSKFISGYGVPAYGDDGEKTAAPAAAPASGKLPLIKNGATGDAVKAAQALLNTLSGSGLDVDGDFGSLTEAAVRNWQACHRDKNGDYLEIDGEIGPLTWGTFFLC